MSSDTRREVTIERVASKKYTATNSRGGQVSIGAGADGGTDFTPVELLLAAIAGCTAIDVDIVTTRRAEPDSFGVEVTAEQVRDTTGNRLTDISVRFRVAFPEGEDGDKARAILPDIVKKSHDHLCTVGRTVEDGTPIATHID